MKLSIITLTYNKLDYTKKYIESLFKYTKDFELIIVDNGSTDGTVEYLKSIPNLKLILNKENLGFSRGNNQGIEIATGEYIGFLNNDILLSPNWFGEIENIFKTEPNAGFISPRHIHSYFSPATEENYIQYFSKNNKNKNYEKSFDECAFSCVITKRNVIDDIGLFDENYTPAFFEDDDLKYRSVCKGYSVLVANEVCFYHFGSITSKKFNKNFEKNRKYYYDKYPFAAYLSANSLEKDKLRRMARQFKIFPLKQIYQLYRLPERIKNRLKRFNKN